MNSKLTALIKQLNNREDPIVAIYAAITLREREIGDREAIPYLVDIALGRFNKGDVLRYPLKTWTTEEEYGLQCDIVSLRHESAVSACALGYEPQNELETEVFSHYLQRNSYYFKVETYDVVTRSIVTNMVKPVESYTNDVGRWWFCHYYR